MSISRGFQRAVFSENTAAQFEVVPAPGGSKKIRIRGLFLSAAAAQDIDLQSSSNSLGIINLVAGTSMVLPLLGGGTGEAWQECALEEALNITLGQAAQTDGVILYDIVNTTGEVL